MAKSATLTLKGAAAAVVKAAAKALSAHELGAAIADAGFRYQDIALQVIALLGASVYSEKDGLPKWGKLPAALKAADHKVSRNEFAIGMATRWDKRYLNGALADPKVDERLYNEQVQYRALVKACGVKNAEMFCSLTPAAKGKLSGDNDAKAEKVQELSTILNKAFSASWGAMKAADDKRCGRSKKGNAGQATLQERLQRTAVEALPKAIAKAVEEGFDVHGDWKEIARLILKNRWAKVEAEAE